MRLVRGSHSITSLADWREHAAPKGGDLHWVAGRSAMELARAWWGDDGPVVPDEVADALRSHPDLAELRIIEMVPEARVAVDRRRGEPRNADLAGIAVDADGTAVVHVEGKADEPFGDRVGDVLTRAEVRQARGESTGAPERVRDLVTALLTGGASGAETAGELRYQLLTATAAVLADAKRSGATRAVLLVHEFVTERTDDENHRRNAAELDEFVRRLSGGAFEGVGAGRAVGPIHVPGAPLVEQPVPLYVAKAVRDVRRTTP